MIYVARAPTGPASTLSRWTSVKGRLKGRRWHREWTAFFGLVLITLSVTGFVASRLTNDILWKLQGSPDRVSVNVVPTDGRFVGRWLSPEGRRILFVKSGAVWADPDLLGNATFDAADSSRLSFAGDGFRCTYLVRFHGQDETDWRLSGSVGRMNCPQGKFTRHILF